MAGNTENVESTESTETRYEDLQPYADHLRDCIHVLRQIQEYEVKNGQAASGGVYIKMAKCRLINAEDTGRTNNAGRRLWRVLLLTDADTTKPTTGGTVEGMPDDVAVAAGSLMINAQGKKAWIFDSNERTWVEGPTW